MTNQKQGKVHFDLTPRCLIIPNEMTLVDIERHWWTRSEVSATKQSCRWIAKESRKLGQLTDCVDELSRLAKSKLFHESNLLETDAARRVVRCSINSPSIRGLEHFICGKPIQSLSIYRSKICHLHRMSTVNAEMLCRISQRYSQFDRAMARLLGEADALNQFEQGYLNKGDYKFQTARRQSQDYENFLLYFTRMHIMEERIGIEP